MATDYVPGPDLHAVVGEQHGPLPEESVRALPHGLAQALRAVHGAGLIHRDLKPSNVLVTVEGPRIIDFGIAHAVTGRSRFGTADNGLHALLFRGAHEEPEPAGVPDSLLGLVQQCLEKDPALRPLPREVAAHTVAVTTRDAPWLPPQPEPRPERWRPRGPRAENR
ncbi:protein kinase [Streptomyces sp. NPDC018059]|uniref:protein kinase domain-containing protein n=1 Tax=Streptomyces sp. NPDC018059 TaxID=3365041 RepID=UPI0037B3FEA4